MALTREELLLAAGVAEKYPEGTDPGHWGYGPLAMTKTYQVEYHLGKNPADISYG